MKKKPSLSELVSDINKYKHLIMRCELYSEDYWKYQDKITLLTRQFNDARLELKRLGCWV